MPDRANSPGPMAFCQRTVTSGRLLSSATIRAPAPNGDTVVSGFSSAIDSGPRV